MNLIKYAESELARISKDEMLAEDREQQMDIYDFIELEAGRQATGTKKN